MSIFRVGQRVRIVRVVKTRAPGSPHCLGREATIWRIDADDKPYCLDIDGIGKSNPADGGLWGCDSSFIEPIQPERNRIVAWESLPIDPRKVLEHAT